MRRLLVAFALLVVLPCLIGAGQTASTAPAIVTADAPLLPADTLAGAIGEGEVRLHVRTDGHRVVKATPFNEDKTAPFFAQPAHDNLASWTFGSGGRESFDVTYRYERFDRHDCSANRNARISMTLPNEIYVETPAHVLCDYLRTELMRPVLRARDVVGTLRCECADGLPIPGAGLHVEEEGENSSFRSLVTDESGVFAAHHLSAGRYRLQIGAGGFENRTYEVDVDPSYEPQTLDLRLKPGGPVFPPAPPALITAAAVPLYPSEALRNGDAGIVNVRLTLGTNSFVDVDADSPYQTLADAAMANARTWRFTHATVNVLRVQYHYVLEPAPCGSDLRPHVTLDFPDRITIEAKRPTGCS
jgi:hypothetical protein